MEKLPKPILEKKKMSLNDSFVERTGNDVVSIQNLSKSYNGRNIFKDVDLKMRYKDKIAIIGRNGCGKTTLLRIILGEEQPDYGTVKLGTKLKIGYLQQNTTFEETTATILDYYCDQFGISQNEARNQLAKILFTGNDVYKKIGTLSGGEKKRLQLSILMSKNPNFLILDEPTNHLDLASREILEENLENFEGNLLIASHDRYFVNKMASRLWVYNNESFQSIDGNYEYYRQNKERLLKKTNYSRQNAYPHNNNTSKKNVDQEECERDI